MSFDELKLTGQEPCLSADPELFFAMEGQRDLVTAAKQLCRACPSQGRCLQWAMANPRMASDGIWGGTTASERDMMRRHRAPARVAVEQVEQQERRVA